MAHRKGEVVGRLRISAPIAFGIRHLAPLLGELADRHPQLDVDLSLSDRTVDLVAERFDAAVRIGDLGDSTLVARRIAPIHAILVASPAYLAAHGRPKTPADLADHECLNYSSRTVADWTFRSGKRWISVRPRSRLRSDNGEAVLQWAISGHGIAQAPTFFIADAIERGDVVPVLTDYPAPEFGLYAVRPAGPAPIRQGAGVHRCAGREVRPGTGVGPLHDEGGGRGTAAGAPSAAAGCGRCSRREQSTGLTPSGGRVTGRPAAFGRRPVPRRPNIR